MYTLFLSGKIRLVLLAFIFLLLTMPFAFADWTQARCGIYPKEEEHTDVSVPCVFSQRQGFITIRISDQVTYDFSPQGDTPGHYKDAQGDNVYRLSGLGKKGLIFRFKTETINVYWDSARLEKNTYQLSYARQENSVSNDESDGFDKSLQLNGIQFHISSANNSSINTLTIKPAGLKIDNSVIVQEIDGMVTGAEIADINADGSPEIYIYIHSAGSGSYGNLVAYSANQKKSLSGIYLPPLMDNKLNSKGYMGHDEFSVVENSLVRRFPIYDKEDSNSNPTGGMRQLYYKLIAGEASWRLKLYNTREF